HCSFVVRKTSSCNVLETKIHQLYCNLTQWCSGGVLYQKNFVLNGAQKRGS
nr:hypothetical protein [Tanacetum cinerariifolium]